MNTRALGRTGLQMAEPGIGCTPIANLFAPVLREAATATLQPASWRCVQAASARWIRFMMAPLICP